MTRDTRRSIAFWGRSAARAAQGFSMIELLMVVAVSGVIAAIAIPMISGVGRLRIDGDARSLSHAVTQAKMVAAAKFTRSRLYVDLTTNSYHTEFFNRATNTWTWDGGETFLSNSTETFGFGPVATPPPNSQAAIAQAPPCLTDLGAAIGNTACIVFNSRGIPIVPATGAPTGAGALYVSDPTAVFGVTVAATSAVRLWRTEPVAAANWVQP